MNTLTQSLHDQKVQSIAQDLEKQDYHVTIEPSIEKLPFDLDGYCPDLIATKNGSGIILEVKGTFKRLSIGKFQDIAETVRRHPGWRFWLVTLDDTGESILDSPLPSWDILRSRLEKLGTLIQASLFEPAILFAWTILEPLLRKQAIAHNLPIDRFPFPQLLNHIYSSAEISMDDFDLFKECLEIKDKVAHGMQVTIDSEVLRSLYQSLQVLIQEGCQQEECSNGES